MKAGVIFFHSNLSSLYPRKWIDDCVNSIYHQTYKDFTVYELNYGGTADFYYPAERSSQYQQSIIKLPNHSEAQNHILNIAFKDCDIVFNTNMDDIYRSDRNRS